MRMLILMAMALGAFSVFAQEDEELRTYMIRVDGGAPFGGFYREMDIRGMVEVRPDTPWDPSQSTWRRYSADRVEVLQESQLSRDKRREEGWRQAGYEKVAGAPPGAQWQRPAEIEFSQRARAMAQEVLADWPEPPPGSSGAPGSVPAASSASGNEDLREQAPVWPRYAAHGGIGLAALALLAVIGKTTIWTR